MNSRLGQCSKYGGLRKSTVVDITPGGRWCKGEMRCDVQGWCMTIHLSKMDDTLNLGCSIPTLSKHHTHFGAVTCEKCFGYVYEMYQVFLVAITFCSELLCPCLLYRVVGTLQSYLSASPLIQMTIKRCPNDHGFRISTL